MAVSLEHERVLWDAGARVVAGIDEVGRGALAGPVTVGVCAVAPCHTWPAGLADSKRLSAAKREDMLLALAQHDGTGFGLARAVGHASPAEIDAHGIVAALRIAGHRALAQIAGAGVVVDAIVLDGKHDWLTPPPVDLFDAAQSASDREPEYEAHAEASALISRVPPPVTMVIKGDDLCASIAAGSILAKVERDAIMVAAHEAHPHYQWSGNKGYGAAAHLDAIRDRGPTDFHRRSWSLPAPHGD
ncbi:ribonuclease HII [Demequina globuliformis]|uniref:ribonuclease HII n=1 Tax=Demequina globuliformis TaxID=676202 RepID=UPI0007844D11|nr:ribonuclease HII [Demequina globuliformis]